MSVVVQGKQIAAEAAEVKLPDGATLIEAEGKLPEILVDGVAHLADTNGKLYPRTVNTATGHAAISIPPAPRVSRRGSSVASAAGAVD